MGELIRFDEQLHASGERCGVRDVRVAIALAWWIAAELVRRHPGELRVIETHPGDGQYNCVSVYRVPSSGEPDLVIHMNVTGSLTHGSWFGGGGERFNWLEVLLCEDRRSYVVQQIERAERLGSPAQTPTSDSSSLGPMVISAFLERSMLGPARWTAVNGLADSSGGAGLRTELFEQVPGASQWASRVDGEIAGRSEFRFWFVGPAAPGGVFSLERPEFAVDTWTGHLWRRGSDERVDLLGAYVSAGRRLDALVSAVCPPAF